MRSITLQLMLAGAMVLPGAFAQVKSQDRVLPSTQGLPALSLAELRVMYPALDGLDDNDALDVLHSTQYRTIDRSTLAAIWQVAPRKTLENKKLGTIDKWRFESCQDSATKAPTLQGVNKGLSICRERFGQLAQ